MTVAYVGLGGNLDDPRQHIIAALGELNLLPTTRLTRQSSLYLSQPVGPVDQPDYINAVAALRTGLSARRLLDYLLEIEGWHGRIRDGVRWGPRTLDLDLLLYGNMQIQEEGLMLPHPRLHERNFVLVPLYEIASQLVIPAHGPLSGLLDQCPTARLILLDTG